VTILVYGSVPLIGSFIDLSPKYDDYKVVGVRPALEQGYEYRFGDTMSPRAWWVTLEVADPVELRDWQSFMDGQQVRPRSFLDRVLGR
jgi:hypothetical protein